MTKSQTKALWIVVVILFGGMWIARQFEAGPLQSTPSESPRYLVATSGFGCTTEQNALRLEDAVSRRDQHKMEMLIDTGACFNTVPSYVPLTFESGTFGTGVRRVSWPATQGESAGSGYIGPSYVEYMTDAELDEQWEAWRPICEEYTPGDCDTGR